MVKIGGSDGHKFYSTIYTEGANTSSSIEILCPHGKHQYCKIINVHLVYHSAQYCIVLYCTALYYTALYCIVLHCIVLHWINNSKVCQVVDSGPVFFLQTSYYNSRILFCFRSLWSLCISRQTMKSVTQRKFSMLYISLEELL